MTTKTIGQLINELPPGVFKTLCKVTPSGALQARKSATGASSLYWRYSLGSSSERVLIGLYDSSAPPKSLNPTKSGYSVAAAIRAAEVMAVQHHQHRDEGGRPALLAAQCAAELAKVEAQRQAEATSLEHLLTAYVNYLKSIGRRSHSDSSSIFRLHVFEAWPQVAKMPAKDVPSECFADMMRRLIDAGKGRTANKLRSYCRAAYQTAKAAKSKPSIPVSFKKFEIKHNPVADTEPDESQNRADKRPLSAVEMRAYWQAIKRMEGFKGALLRLHLLTGGQRIEQLVNLTTANIREEGVMVLMDRKGRPGRLPRQHLVPLVELAQDALTACQPVGRYALSTDGGETHVAATTLSCWAAEAAADVVADFQAKRIRSGVETLLASVGVSRDVRGLLQSHGISGVQSRHYDGHDYLPEKRRALETLLGLLEQRPKVEVEKARAQATGPIRRRASAGTWRRYSSAP